MRTTLDIAEDVLQPARERARRESRTIGEVISELARRGLLAPDKVSAVREPKAVYELRPIGRRGGIVTNELINSLREVDSY